MKICSWCGFSYNNGLAGRAEFTLHFLHETCAEDSGCAGWGFDADGLCFGCGAKLKDKLEELGLKLTEVDY